MKIKHIDHIGINVIDLKAAKVFFLDLGFTILGEMKMKGEWAGRIIGLQDVQDDILMLQAPDGKMNIELIKFHNTVDTEGIHESYANTLGPRHLCFQVENPDEIIKKLNEKGIELIGEV